MLIDTGTVAPVIIPKSAEIDDTQRPDLRHGIRAERIHRQIIEAIERHECPRELDDYMTAETVILDEMYLAWPDFSAAIQDAYETHRICLVAGGATTFADSPQAGAPEIAQSQQKEKPMFVIDTGSEGASKGPWISWTSNGSAMKGFAPKSWVLRGKDDNGDKEEVVIPAFANGCVLDLDTLQLGWMKDGATGQAPEKKWNLNVSQATPRPDESKKPSGAYAWSAALSIRCAIGGGKAATWEQASFGAYDAFSKLAKQISAEWGEKSENGKFLPLVKQTGVDTQVLKSGASNKPVLVVEKWVPRPDCLKDDAPVIATAPAPQQSTAPAVAPADAVPADAEFF